MLDLNKNTKYILIKLKIIKLKLIIRCKLHYLMENKLI